MIRDILLNLLENALGPHSQEHEYFVYDTIDIYVIEEYDFRSESLDDVEKYIVEQRMYKYYDKLCHAVCSAKGNNDTVAFKKFLSLPDDFIGHTARYVDFMNVHIPERLKYFDHFLKYASIHALSKYLTHVNDDEKYIRKIIERSKKYPPEISIKLFDGMRIDRSLMLAYLKCGATADQLLVSILIDLHGEDYELLADNILNKELVANVLRNKYHSCVSKNYVNTIRCLLLANCDMSRYNIDPMYIGDMLSPRLYDIYVKHMDAAGKQFSHVTKFIDGFQWNVNVSLHIYKNYIVNDEALMSEFKNMRNHDKYFRRLEYYRITSPSMVRSIVELIKVTVDITHDEYTTLVDLNKTSINNYIITARPDLVKVIFSRMETCKRKYDCLANERLLTRHGKYIKTMCPYENIDVMSESSPALVKYPDLKRLIRSSWKITSESQYHDITFIFE